jgi:microcin C transport system permease protein
VRKARRFSLELSPRFKRRLYNFRLNKRAYFSLYIFLSIFVISLLAEFIANDKPLLVFYDGKFYYPIVKTYLETDFDGDFELEVEYHDPYIQEILKGRGWMIWPIIPFKFDTIDYNLDVPTPSPPSKTHWLGTDDQSHDVLAVVIYGFRISVVFGLVLTIFSSIVGVSAGAIQGYFSVSLRCGRRFLHFIS